MLCQQCEDAEAMVRVRDTVTGTELGLCCECGERIERTFSWIEIVGPVGTPQARIAWAKREITKSVGAMIERLPLREVLRALPMSWFPDHVGDLLAELRERESVATIQKGG